MLSPEMQCREKIRLQKAQKQSKRRRGAGGVLAAAAAKRKLKRNVAVKMRRENGSAISAICNVFVSHC